MKPEAFLADLEAKPTALRELAAWLRARNPWAEAVTARPDRVLFLGMGSSRYAAGVIAARLRSAGIDAVTEYGSAATSYPPAAGTLVVAISATGGSQETLEAASRYASCSPLVALTNDGRSALAELADAVVGMRAGAERGGIACRTFQHTLVLLLALADHLAGAATATAALALRAADATADLLDRRDDWLPPACDLLDSPDGVFTLAPAERLSSARQSALMIREGPRRNAAAAETGDWAHVDVYLTKTLDYRAILFPGSRYDGQAMDWLRQRGSRVLSVGPGPAGPERVIRYRHDDGRDVALLTEVLVAELVAGRMITKGLLHPAVVNPS